MTMNKIFEQAIKAHVKQREELFQYSGIKVISSVYDRQLTCYDGTILTMFKVVTSIKAKKYENNRVTWQINIYDDPKGNGNNTIGVYFDGESYDC